MKRRSPRWRHRMRSLPQSLDLQSDEKKIQNVRSWRNAKTVRRRCVLLLSTDMKTSVFYIKQHSWLQESRNLFTRFHRNISSKRAAKTQFNVLFYYSFLLLYGMWCSKLILFSKLFQRILVRGSGLHGKQSASMENTMSHVDSLMHFCCRLVVNAIPVIICSVRRSYSTCLRIRRRASPCRSFADNFLKWTYTLWI